MSRTWPRSIVLVAALIGVPLGLVAIGVAVANIDFDVSDKPQVAVPTELSGDWTGTATSVDGNGRRLIRIHLPIGQATGTALYPLSRCSALRMAGDQLVLEKKIKNYGDACEDGELRIRKRKDGRLSVLSYAEFTSQVNSTTIMSRASAKGPLQLPASFKGTWVGKTTGTDARTTLDLDNEAPEAVSQVARSDCYRDRGRAVPIAVNGKRVTMLANFGGSGFGVCGSSGSYELTLRGPRTMTFVFREDGSEDTERGTFRRVD
ncbi:hypothetical protein ACGFNU_38935 [Spirillospora sp. NPDC048911]|uniref:hypothetical protein n=1 Tax=Spirillospora sp. NPDC048911 TaxID=3364527 RepID=UPI003712EEA5